MLHYEKATNNRMQKILVAANPKKLVKPSQRELHTIQELIAPGPAIKGNAKGTTATLLRTADSFRS